MTVNEFEYTHSRHQSGAAVILEFPHRATLLSSKEQLAPLRQGSYAIRHRRPHKFTESTYLEGKVPTIVTALESSNASRRPSIQTRRRFMMNRKELKNKFFYPVNGPKRLNSRRGKYRTSVELDASMNYINIDASMSKDLCVNQYVISYELPKRELIKMDPQLREQVKAITVDSKNNVILYTPIPTEGNSSVADAEQILNDELKKLGKPISLSSLRKNSNGFRYSRDKRATFPFSQKPSLLRTRSLPSKVQDERLETLWNLYLRRVIAARIKWRMHHMNQESDYKPTSNRFSMVSSVDTAFFMNHLLKTENSENDRLLTSEQSDHISHLEPQNTGGSRESFVSAKSSPRRRAMLDSLEQLMIEVESVLSTVD
jgi:hypothetical protein